MVTITGYFSPFQVGITAMASKAQTAKPRVKLERGTDNSAAIIAHVRALGIDRAEGRL
jgi:hypothetical protein